MQYNFTPAAQKIAFDHFAQTWPDILNSIREARAKGADMAEVERRLRVMTPGRLLLREQLIAAARYIYRLEDVNDGKRND